MAISDLAFRAAMATMGRSALHRLLTAARDPRAAQVRALAGILAANATTSFGRAHGFAALRDVDTYRTAVPIRDYEALRPWIDRQIGGEAAVTADKVLMYARTSGTTAEPKRLPVTVRTLEQMKRAQRAMAYVQHRACPMFAGRVLAVAGATREETTPDGTPAGSVTGLIYETMPWVVRRKYVVPPEVFSIENAELKFGVVLRLALQHGDLTAVSAANPSTFLRLRDYSRQHWSTLIPEIADGTFRAADVLPPGQREAVKSALFRAPERARELEAKAGAGEPTVGDLWPRLAGIMTWTGGSCALAADVVRAAVPATTRIIEAGYVASELRGTVVIDAERGLALPVLEDVFFEFVPVEDWDAGSRETLLLHELEPGRDYQVIFTTAGGLYRYWINDVLRAGPKIGDTPTLTFMRKGRGVTNITGEKLTEQQVNAAIQFVARHNGHGIPFHLVLADEEKSSYLALLEIEGPAHAATVAESLEAQLRETNIEYASKRSSGRLGAMKVALLRAGAGAAYRRACVARGQRDSQFKVLALQYARECSFDFSTWWSE
ncbi:MAG: GH3 auxin-responsive promoter family protein [Proteobacteria bacterium]|nr:GH3 auxin-responsive promoter family protein [Pseudomonadota bacterium]